MVDGPDPVLLRADAAETLPRLGGMARPDGVVVVSERYWAYATVDGALREGLMANAPRPLRRIPLLRGLVRLSAAIAPMFRRRGVTKPRERAFLVAAILAPLCFFLLPGSARMPAGLALTAALLAWLFRGRTLFLHGAEHRAIAAAETRRLEAAWAGSERPSRFSLRCGTNFAALVLPVTLLAERFWPIGPAFVTPLAVTVVSLALTMELWEAVQASGNRWSRLLLLPGLGLQRLTTREPSLAETRIALRAVASVLRRELG